MVLGFSWQCFCLFPTSSSTLAESPANFVGSGPIILTSCGTSRLPILQNFPSAFMHRQTCSSGGLPCSHKRHLYQARFQFCSKYPLVRLISSTNPMAKSVWPSLLNQFDIYVLAKAHCLNYIPWKVITQIPLKFSSAKYFKDWAVYAHQDWLS